MKHITTKGMSLKSLCGCVYGILLIFLSDIVKKTQKNKTMENNTGKYFHFCCPYIKAKHRGLRFEIKTYTRIPCFYNFDLQTKLHTLKTYEKVKCMTLHTTQYNSHLSSPLNDSLNSQSFSSCAHYTSIKAEISWKHSHRRLDHTSVRFNQMSYSRHFGFTNLQRTLDISLWFLVDCLEF